MITFLGLVAAVLFGACLHALLREGDRRIEEALRCIDEPPSNVRVVAAPGYVTRHGA